MSVLTNPIIVIPAISLISQVIVLIMLVYGYWMYRKLAFQRHARVMTSAIIIHLITVFAVMIPSFVLAVIPEYIIIHFFELISLLTLIHVPLGTTSIILATYFAIGWRLQGLKGCYGRRKLMILTMITWPTSTSVGIVLYALFYLGQLASFM